MTTDANSDDLNRLEQIRAARIAHMQRLVDEGRASGISDRTMDEIVAEARAEAIARAKSGQSQSTFDKG